METQDINAQENKFTQLCLMPSTFLNEDEPTNPTKEQIEEFEEFINSYFDVRIKYETTVLTQPDLDSFGKEIPDTGGRSDLLFYIHSDDIIKFATKRFRFGIKWWEDVISYNDPGNLYTQEFKEKYPATW